MKSKENILVVDDDRQITRSVQSHLEARGYNVFAAFDGSTALKMAQQHNPDLVVLDINLPKGEGQDFSLDGIEVLRRLRDADKEARVLMLSATNVAAIKVMTLTIGADDYLAKPFDMEELGARVSAILRRGEDSPSKEILEFHRLRLDPNELRVWKDGNPVELTKLEFNILYALARRPDHVLTREKLLELAWGCVTSSAAKAVDVHIGHIRKKINDDAEQPEIISTVRGTGYRFEDRPRESGDAAGNGSKVRAAAAF